MAAGQGAAATWEALPDAALARPAGLDGTARQPQRLHAGQQCSPAPRLATLPPESACTERVGRDLGQRCKSRNWACSRGTQRQSCRGPAARAHQSRLACWAAVQRPPARLRRRNPPISKPCLSPTARGPTPPPGDARPLPSSESPSEPNLGGLAAPGATPRAGASWSRRLAGHGPRVPLRKRQAGSERACERAASVRALLAESRSACGPRRGSPALRHGVERAQSRAAAFRHRGGRAHSTRRFCVWSAGAATALGRCSPHPRGLSRQ